MKKMIDSSRWNFMVPVLKNTTFLLGLGLGLITFGSCQENRATGSKSLADEPELVLADTTAKTTTADNVTDTTASAGTVGTPATAAAGPAASDEAAKTGSAATTEEIPAVKAPEIIYGKEAILPTRRIIAFYGNPLSKRMGIMGELPPDQMLSKLDKEVAAWEKADSAMPVQPALHLIAVTAQSQPGRGNKYRLRMTDKLIEQVIDMASRRNALVFLDIQVGQSTLQEELPRLEKYFAMPNVHLGIDPEFSMKGDYVPGRRIGTFDAEDINYATSFLAEVAAKNQIPPKILVVHRFTQRMVTNYQNIRLNPKVQIVMHMDGFGPATLKRDTYRRYIQKEPVQYTGFKLFYKNDNWPGATMMKPEDILKLNPKPVYIQYQ